MNYKEIENLKTTLMQMTKQGCRISSQVFGIDGTIVGIGFKPYWTNPIDSKIEKLEFNFRDGFGRIIPFYLYNVIGYDVVSYDGRKPEDSKNISLDMHVFAPDKARDVEPFDKVRVDITIQ